MDPIVAATSPAARPIDERSPLLMPPGLPPTNTRSSAATAALNSEEENVTRQRADGDAGIPLSVEELELRLDNEQVAPSTFTRFCGQILPLLLLVAACRPTAFGVVYAVVFTASVTSATASTVIGRSGSPFLALFPRRAVCFVAAALGLAGIVTVSVFLAMDSLRNAPSYVAVLGPEFMTSSPADRTFGFVVAAVWAHVCVLVVALLVAVRPQSIAPGSDLADYPRWLAPAFYMGALAHLLSAEWIVLMATGLIAGLRRCVLSVPLALCFAGASIVALHRPGELTFPTSASGVLLGLVSGFYLTYTTGFMVKEARPFGVSPDQDMLSLWMGIDSSRASNFAFLVVLGVILYGLSVYHIGRFYRVIRATAPYARSASVLDEMTPRASARQAPPPLHADSPSRTADNDVPSPILLEAVWTFLATYGLQTQFIKGFLNIAVIYVLCNLTASVIGAVWVAMWIVTITIDPNRRLSVLICWTAILHLMALFAGGFAYVSQATFAAYVGLTMPDSTAQACAIACIVFLAVTNVAWARMPSSSTRDAPAASFVSAASKEKTYDNALTAAPRYMLRIAQTALSDAANWLRSRLQLIAFAVLLVAAAASITMIHAPFLVLFGVTIVWRKPQTVLWKIAATYSCLLCAAVYATNVLVPTTLPPWLMRLGFFHGRSTLSTCAAWAVTSVNIALLLTVCSVHGSSIVGLAYLVLFVVAVHMATVSSWTRPSASIQTVWGILTVAMFIVTATVYVVQIGNLNVADAVTPVLDDARIYVWPMVASLLVSVVQLRIWNVMDAADATPPTFVTSVLQFVASFAPVLIVSILFAASVINIAFYRADYPVTLMHVTYAFLGLAFAVFPEMHDSLVCSFIVRVVAVTFCVAILVTQRFGLLQQDWTIIGLPKQLSDDAMWYLLFPHVMVYPAACLHRAARSYVAATAPADTLPLQAVGVAATGTAAVSVRWQTPALRKYYTIGFEIVLLTCLIAAYTQRDTVMGLVIFLLCFVKASVGQDRMETGLQWNLLVGLMMALVAAQFSDAIIRYNRYAAFGAWTNYFSVGTHISSLAASLSYFGALVLHRSAIIARYDGSDAGVSRVWMRRAGNVLTLDERLAEFSHRIAIARKHRAVNLMRRLIPVPEHRPDFTLLPTTLNRLKRFCYQNFVLAALTCSFLYCVYDASTSIEIAKLALLAATLGFLQVTEDVTWRGNALWRWNLRLHLLLDTVRFVYAMPIGAPGGEFIGLVPSTIPRSWQYPLEDLAFHGAVLALYWIYSAILSSEDYAFFLHDVHRRHIVAEEVGKAIADNWRQRVLTVKARRDADYQARKATLRQDILRDDSRGTEGEEDLRPTAATAAPRADDDDSRRHEVSEAADAGPAAATRLVYGDYDEVTAPAVAPTPATAAGATRDSSSIPPDGIGRPTEGVVATSARLIAALWLQFVDRVIAWLRAHSFDDSQAAAARRQLSSIATAPRDNGDDGAPSSAVFVESAPPDEAQPAGRPIQFVHAVSRFVASHSVEVCYVFFCLHFAVIPSVLNMLMPLSVFVYAASMNPRPHVVYWSACLVYLQFVILFKSLMKTFYCGSDFSILFGRLCDADGFINDIVADLVCVLALRWHKSRLIGWGLWNDDSLRTDATVIEPQPSKSIGPASSSRSLLRDDDSSKPHTAVVAKDNLFRSTLKPGSDYYARGFGVELLAFVLLFFLYYQIQGSQSSSIVSSVQNSVLPGELAITMIVLFALMAVDRVVQLSRNLPLKFALTILLALFYHLVMLIWYANAVAREQSIYGSISFFLRGSLPWASLLFLLKAYYLFLGSSQVRKGFVPFQQHIVFTGNYSTLEFIVYFIVRNAPFVFDLQVVLDWSVTTTVLKMNQWIKLYDVCHELYYVQVDIVDSKMIDESKRGDKSQPYPPVWRVVVGWFLFLLVSCVLLLPLLFYSSFSPVLQDANVVGSSATLYLPGAPPMWQQSLSVSPQSTRLNESELVLMERTRHALLNLDRTKENAQLVAYSPMSGSVWGVSPPALRSLEATLLSSDDITLTLQLSLRSSIISVPEHQIFYQKRLSNVTCRELRDMFTGNRSNVTIPSFFVPFVENRPADAGVLPFADGVNTIDCRLSSAQGTDSSFTFFAFECRTLFNLSNPNPPPEWNGATEAETQCMYNNVECPNYATNGGGRGWDGVYFIAFSFPVLTATLLQSIGIIAAYTGFVFAIGRVLRFAFTGGAMRTSIEDMEDPTKLIHMVEYCFMARTIGDYQDEALAYKKLVDTLRVTERLERKTRAKIKAD